MAPRSVALLKSFLIFLAVLFSTNICMGQSPWDGAAFSAEPKTVLAAAREIKPEKYAKVTVLRDERSLSIDRNQRVTMTFRLIYRIEAQEAVEEWGHTGTRWSPWRQSRPRIRARVISADGSVHELDAKVLSEAPVRDSRPDIYEDDKIYSGPLPAVAPGAIIEEETVTEDTAPFAESGVLRRLYFGRVVPVQRTVVTVETAEGVPLKYKSVLLPNLEVKKVSANGVTRTTFEQGPLKAIQNDEVMVPDDVATWPALELSTAQSWGAVAADYEKLSSAQIRPADVAKLLAGEKLQGLGRDALVKRLTAVLHREMRYTGLEFGESGLVPHTTGESLTRKYGDCKDKAAVLVAMLRHSGIEAKIALLATRPDDDVDAELPGLSRFDHAIVYVPGTPEIWVDATAEFSPAGSLPWNDQGRSALVVDSATKALKRTPIASSKDNASLETRVFYLAEFGPARIVETSVTKGEIDAEWRARYGGAESKEVREELENYVKSAYLAEALTKFEHSPGRDIEKPFEMRVEVAKAKRGSTSMTDAAVAIYPAGLVYRLPAFLKSEEKSKDDDADEEEGQSNKGPRKNDLLLMPFVAEWHYKIAPPPGFRVRALPENQTRDIGPFKLSQSYTQGDDGTVEGNFRFDTVKARLTPAEVTAVQASVAALLNEQGVLINFDQLGFKMLAEGKVREGLAEFERLARLHPKEALHRVQKSTALLQSGFGEEARKEALKAVELDPNSAQAQSTLAWTLQHDLLGRRFKSGFDRNGAIAAYKKAISLDPKDTDQIANLAILLEHDAAGERYTPQANMKEAVAEYKEIQKVDKTAADGWNDNLLYALFYAGDYAEAQKFAASLTRSNVRNSIRLASIIASGATNVVEQSKGMSFSESERTTALADAATLMQRIRKYEAAADLLEAALAGQPNASQFQTRIRMTRSTKRYEDQLIPETDPKGIVQRFFGALLHDKVDELQRIVDIDPGDMERQVLSLRRASTQMGNLAAKIGLPRNTLLDTVVSNLQIAVEGDERTGYRLRVQSVGAPTQTFYISGGSGQKKIVGSQDDISLMGNEVLKAIDAGNMAAAKQWLDWARESQQLQGNDDPLAGPVFPRFWSRGDSADAGKMRLAGISMLVTTSYGKKYVPELQAARAKATGKDEQLRLDVAVARALGKSEQWVQLKPVAEKLLAEYPTSPTAFGAVTSAARSTKDWASWERAVQLRFERFPDDIYAIRSASQLAESQGDISKARATIRKLIDSGRAEPMDLNSYTWDAIFEGKVTDEEISLAQRATSLEQGKTYAMLHTLACLYAEVGKGKEAREQLLEAMDAGNLAEADGPIWYGMGRIAELYGLSSAASSAYSRVEKRKEEEGAPNSTYELAQRRKRGLPKEDAVAVAPEGRKSAGQMK